MKKHQLFDIHDVCLLANINLCWLRTPILLTKKSSFFGINSHVCGQVHWIGPLSKIMSKYGRQTADFLHFSIFVGLNGSLSMRVCLRTGS